MAHQGEVTDTAKIKIIDEIPFGINGHNTASHTHIPVFLRPKFVDHTSTHVVDRSHCGSAHTPRGQRCGGGGGGGWGGGGGRGRGKPGASKFERPV